MANNNWADDEKTKALLLYGIGENELYDERDRRHDDDASSATSMHHTLFVLLLTMLVLIVSSAYYCYWYCNNNNKNNQQQRHTAALSDAEKRAMLELRLSRFQQQQHKQQQQGEDTTATAAAAAAAAAAPSKENDKTNKSKNQLVGDDKNGAEYKHTISSILLLSKNDTSNNPTKKPPSTTNIPEAAATGGTASAAIIECMGTAISEQTNIDPTITTMMTMTTMTTRDEKQQQQQHNTVQEQESLLPSSFLEEVSFEQKDDDDPEADSSSSSLQLQQQQRDRPQRQQHQNVRGKQEALTSTAAAAGSGGGSGGANEASASSRPPAATTTATTGADDENTVQQQHQQTVNTVSSKQEDPSSSPLRPQEPCKRASSDKNKDSETAAPSSSSSSPNIMMAKKSSSSSSPSPSPPPVQILCHALSLVTGLTVSVVSSSSSSPPDSSSTWGGHNWNDDLVKKSRLLFQKRKKLKNRENHRSSSKSSSSSDDNDDVIQLPFVKYQESSKLSSDDDSKDNDAKHDVEQEEWQDVARALQSILRQDQVETSCLLFRKYLLLEEPSSIAHSASTSAAATTWMLSQAIPWHAKCRSVASAVVKEIYANNNQHEQQQQQQPAASLLQTSLQACLNVFARFIMDTCVEVMKSDIDKVAAISSLELLRHQNVDGDDDGDVVESELFGDDYGEYASDIVATSAKNDTQQQDPLAAKHFGSFGQLLLLLEKVETVIPKPFLGDLITADNELKKKHISAPAATTMDDGLSDILLNYSLCRIPRLAEPEAYWAQEGSNAVTPSTEDIYKSLTLLSNILILSTSSADGGASQKLARRLEGEWLQYQQAENKCSSRGSGTNKTQMSTTARDYETCSCLARLVSLAAYTVPHLGSDELAPRNRPGQQQQHQQQRRLSALAHALRAQCREAYPLCAYRRTRNPDTESLTAILQQAQHVMGLATTVCARTLKQIMLVGATKKKEPSLPHLGAAAEVGSISSSSQTMTPVDMGRRALLDWLGVLVRSNEPLVNMLQADLLSVEGPQKLCSSRPFLLGTTSALLSLCSQSLFDRIEKIGADAFDPLYLIPPTKTKGKGESVQFAPEGGMLGLSPEERRLLIGVASKWSNVVRSSDDVASTKRFAGATEFFFLTSALLRCSLFPALRIDHEFHQRYNKVLRALPDLLGKTPDELSAVPEQFWIQARQCTDVQLGWDTFLRDPDFVTRVTKFSLLQLRWLVAISGSSVETATIDSSTTNSTPAFAVIPEWLAKLPAQWISHVAMTTPTLLRLADAEDAVKYATQLLQACGATNGKYGAAQSQLSPPVLTQLIRIPGGFVRAGVTRARQREKARNRRHGRKANAEDDNDVALVDDRDLDIYSTFEADDHGVTALTNEFVMNHLGSSLISIFSELDAVEGVDVELENNFDKFSVKRDVAELLLRLWSHPSGVARASIVCLEAEKISVFVSSVAAAIGLLLDDACLKLADVRDLLLEGTTSRAFGLNFEFLSRAIACMLFSSRRMLLLLCYISEDKRIASICGGVNTKGTTATSNTAPVDLASMFSNFMDRLTAEDGGTNPGLDLRRSTMPTSELCLKSSKMSDSARHAATKDLLWARRFVLDEYGLDISVMAHQFLALAARWHTAADSGTSRYSQFLRRLATHGECSAAHLQAVFTRLVIPCDQLNEEAILESDGHVDFDVWKGKYDIQPSRKKGSRKPDYQYFTAQDQVTHDRLVSVVSHDAISTFIDDLKNVTVKSAVASRNKDDSIDGETITLLENSLLADSPPCADDKEYSECLCEWVVSSDSFLSRAGTGRFAHSYDATARKRSNDNIGSGKVLVKEAKKCEKHLPAPNVNSSIFVCFAEERMDLCRAIIIGAADTPYSLGMFEFDVFFPVMYPFAAPLVTFKTTGSGQVRFNPNLYNDGKVCISLLGTTSAANKTQRWNPNESSLAQVLGSIQTQILGVAEPYFNEGFGHEMMLNTSAGAKGSKRYNNDLRLECLRHAIVDYLKCPPQGFEEVTRLHFSLCRKRLLVQARLWTKEAQGTPKAKRFERAYCELVELLSNQERFPGSEPALPPLEHDLQALLALDPSFSQIIGDKKETPALPTSPFATATTTKMTSPLCGGVVNQASSSSSSSTEASRAPVAAVSVPLAAAAAAAEANSADSSYNPWAAAAAAACDDPNEENETDQTGQAVGNAKDEDLYS